MGTAIGTQSLTWLVAVPGIWRTCFPSPLQRLPGRGRSGSHPLKDAEGAQCHCSVGAVWQAEQCCCGWLHGTGPGAVSLIREADPSTLTSSGRSRRGARTLSCGVHLALVLLCISRATWALLPVLSGCFLFPISEAKTSHFWGRDQEAS